MTRRPTIALIVLFAGIAFLLSLGRRDIATSHEARVAETAREMAITGWPWSARLTNAPPVALTNFKGMVRLSPDLTAEPVAVNTWAVPLLNGEIRLQKPPLPYWCSAILFRLFGFSEATARLAPALLGVISTFFLYDLARMLMGRWKARLAALVWVTTLFIPEEFRKAMADSYLAFFTLICVWAWIKSSQIQRGNAKTADDSRSSFLYVVIFYCSLGFGLLAKGPPLFLHLGLAITAFHYCYRWPLPRGVGAHLVGLLVLSVVAIPWPWYVVNHIPHAVALWRYESIGELSDNVENARPFWFYAPNSFYITLPWVIAWVTGIAVPFSRPKFRRNRIFAVIWLGATLIFFSFVNLKKTPYLLPAAPAQTLIIAEGLAAALAVARRANAMTWGGGVLAGQSAVGITGCIFLIGALHIVSPGAHGMMILAVMALAVCCWTIVVLQFRKPMLWLLWQATGYGLIVLGFMLGVETAIDNARSSKAVCAELRSRLDMPDTAILRSRLPEEVAVYLPLNDQSSLARHVLVIVDDQLGSHERSGSHKPFLTPPPSNFDSSLPDGRVMLVDRVPMKSAPGDARWKVFELTVERYRYAAR